MTDKPQKTLDEKPVWQQTPEHIWLLLHEGDENSHVWCDDPDPTGNGDIESVEYIRADIVEKMIDAASAASGVRDDD